VLSKNEIGATWQVSNMGFIFHFQGVEHRLDRQLWLRSASTNSTHERASRLGAHDVASMKALLAISLRHKGRLLTLPDVMVN
jgi:hypothetical protein